MKDTNTDAFGNWIARLHCGGAGCRCVSGQDSQRARLHTRFLGHKRKQLRQANEIAKQLFDVEVISIGDCQQQLLVRFAGKFETEMAHALTAVGRVAQVSERVEDCDFELVFGFDRWVVDAADDVLKRIYDFSFG